MLVENFTVSKIIFARRAILVVHTGSTGMSSDKHDHYDHRHNDERWSELIIACSFIDVTNFTLILILYGLLRKNLLEFLKMYPGN